MKKLLTILFAFALGLNLSAQTEYVDDWNPDADGDDLIGITDLLALLSLFAEADSDGDGIWDSVDDCIGVYDPCGVCNGTGEDVDEDGLCDDVDDCIGEYDECGVCNGPGPTFPVIDEILYATDSLFIEPLDEWYVFEYATDTLFTYVCPVSGCTDEEAGNYNPEVVIDDGTCAYGPAECFGASTVTFDGYTYDLVVIGDQCWFAENLQTAVYANGDSIQGQLSTTEWLNTSEGAQAIYGNIPAYLESRGRLYNWFAINDNRNVCPFGWRVPSDTEFKDLEMILGMSESESNSEGWRGTDQGQQMKSSNWASGSNSSGFTAIASGYRRNDGLFVAINDYTGFWSSTSNGTELAWNRQLYGGWPEVYRGGDASENNNGLSVRCVRD